MSTIKYEDAVNTINSIAHLVGEKGKDLFETGNIQYSLLKIVCGFYNCQQAFHGKADGAIYKSYDNLYSQIGDKQKQFGLSQQIQRLITLTNECWTNLKRHEADNTPGEYSAQNYTGTIAEWSDSLFDKTLVGGIEQWCVHVYNDFTLDYSDNDGINDSYINLNDYIGSDSGDSVVEACFRQMSKNLTEDPQSFKELFESIKNKYSEFKEYAETCYVSDIDNCLNTIANKFNQIETDFNELAKIIPEYAKAAGLAIDSAHFELKTINDAIDTPESYTISTQSNSGTTTGETAIDTTVLANQTESDKLTLLSTEEADLLKNYFDEGGKVEYVPGYYDEHKFSPLNPYFAIEAARGNIWPLDSDEFKNYYEMFKNYNDAHPATVAENYKAEFDKYYGENAQIVDSNNNVLNSTSDSLNSTSDSLNSNLLNHVSYDLYDTKHETPIVDKYISSNMQQGTITVNDLTEAGFSEDAAIKMLNQSVLEHIPEHYSTEWIFWGGGDYATGNQAVQNSEGFRNWLISLGISPYDSFGSVPSEYKETQYIDGCYVDVIKDDYKPEITDIMTNYKSVNTNELNGLAIIYQDNFEKIEHTF